MCSFVLIGHWWEEGVNSRAAIKAFLTTRTGDIGLMIGVIITFFAAGTFSIVGINTYALSHGAHHDLMLAGAIALFIGIIGKSGQFPLHTWLPDAMAGPTPVSALDPRRDDGRRRRLPRRPAVPGVLRGLLDRPRRRQLHGRHRGDDRSSSGPCSRSSRTTSRRCSAYSTISQLGYMVMALGVGAWTAAVFHLFTHAFFKALLFLGAGSVSHSGSHHSFDMKKDMGGLRKYMPITFWTFMIGTLALAGIFPFAGFWSKDEILVTAGKSGFDGFLIVGIVGAFLTAAYMARCVYLTFFGEYRGHGHGEPHESRARDHDPADHPRRVLGRWPDCINATPFGHREVQGLGRAPHRLPRARPPRLRLRACRRVPRDRGRSAWASVRTSCSGARSSRRFKDLTKRSRLAHAGYTFLVNKYYLDDLYENVIVDGTRGAVARGVATGSTRTSSTGSSTPRVGAPSSSGASPTTSSTSGSSTARSTASRSRPGMAGGEVRKVQSGRVQRYALILFAGVALLALAIFIINIA